MTIARIAGLLANWPKLSRLSPDRARLVASLFFNFASKAPGVVAILVILPLISRSLGTAAYGELLSAIAIGAAFTLPFGGINASGRRLLAAGVGAGDQTRERDVFVTTVFLTALFAVSLAVLLVTITANSWTKSVFILISLLPIVSSFLNVFDNMRASYNEHYVTAALQLVFQTTIYATVFFIGIPKAQVAVSGLVLQAPFMLASIFTLVLLLWRRPYLRSGKVTGLTAVLYPAIGVILADGALGFSLNVSVYWLNLSGNPEMAAWVGTFARLFQSFMSPVLLIMFPLTTYISVRWGDLSKFSRSRLHKIFIILAYAYGSIVGITIALAGPWYLHRMFALTSSGDHVDVLCLSMFLGAVIAQKAYTMLLYAVSEARFVSYGTAGICILGAVIASIASHWLPAMRVLDVFFAFLGSALPLLLLFGSYRYSRR